jgi:transposase InsO family protein
MEESRMRSETRRGEEIALARHKIIAPVVIAQEDGGDAGKVRAVKDEVCERNGISRRTLRRWLAAYRREGYEGLKPAPHKKGSADTLPAAVVEEAILPRREVPSRSVAQIIEILELEGKVEKGRVKRATLQEKLSGRGYSARQMKLYQQPGTAARRFARLERNDLWHSDIKYAIYLSGSKQQTYLVSFFDDATRYVVHAEFYTRLDQSIVEDCFRKAILKEGVPARVYFDNGKQYRTKWMERACAKLGIKLLYAKPYSPESTGKIERFNRTVDSFLAEVKLKQAKTLEELNQYFQVWLSESYHSRKHAGLGATPEYVYRTGKAALRFLPPETITSAFLHCETRKVDKSGCISFENKAYEVGVLYVGQRVNVLYDPTDTRTLTVEHEPSGKSWLVKPLKIGPHTGPRPKLPDTMSVLTPDTSRLLDEQSKRHEARLESYRGAIRFKNFIDPSEECGENV